MSDKNDPAKHVTEHAGFAEIALSREQTIDGAAVKVMRMREPTAQDLVTFQEGKGSDAARELSMFANLCEVPPAAIGALPVRDYMRLQAAFGLFTS